MTKLIIIKCPDCGNERKYYKYTIDKILNSPYHCKKCSYPYRKKAKYWLGKKHAVDTIEKIKKARANQIPPWLGKKRPKTHKLAISKGVKKLWQNPDYRQSMSNAHKHYTRNQLKNILTRRIPTSYENKLNDILQKNFPNEWKYVGNGEIVIAGKNPDFLNINGKKAIIDLFGEHWHIPSEKQKRIDIFNKYGYQTLIIWGKELRKPDILIQKIKVFLEKII